MLETGTTNKEPDKARNYINIIQHNPAESKKKEQYIHNGKGTAILTKKGVFAATTMQRFNDHKKITAIIVNKDHHLPFYGKVVISAMQTVNSNSDRKW